MNDAVDGKRDVGTAVNDCRRVACTDAQCRFAAAVRRTHHTGTARCQNNVSLFHYKVGHVKAGDINPTDNIFRRTCRNRRVENYLCRRNRGFFSARVRTDDNSVARFESEQSLENSRRCRIGRRYNRGNQTDRLGNLAYTEGFVLFDYAACFCVAVLVVDVFRSVVVFDYFVLNHAHTRFLYGKFRQRNTHFVCGERGGEKNLVHLLLRVGCVIVLRRTHLCDFFFQCLYIVYDSFHGYLREPLVMAKTLKTVISGQHNLPGYYFLIINFIFIIDKSIQYNVENFVLLVFVT